jgi:hypothetical protein
MIHFFLCGRGQDREVIRKYVEHLHAGRPLCNDPNAMKKLVRCGEILDEVGIEKQEARDSSS